MKEKGVSLLYFLLVAPYFLSQFLPETQRKGFGGKADWTGTKNERAKSPHVNSTFSIVNVAQNETGQFGGFLSSFAI